jgi:hypothetical protein
MLAVVAASRDFFQVQPGFPSSPGAPGQPGWPLSGMDLQTAYVPSPLYSPREDSVSTASIVAMVAIFGYSLQRMTARRPLDVVPGRTAMLSVVA